MLELLFTSVALSTMPISAPFLITSEESAEVDRRLDISACNINKNGGSRYYWYDFLAIDGGYKVDPLMVRFAILNDGDSGVHAVAELLMEGEIADKVQAFGLYSIEKDEVEQMICVPQ